VFSGWYRGYVFHKSLGFFFPSILEVLKPPKK
jgi:hypothetical protein